MYGIAASKGKAQDGEWIETFLVLADAVDFIAQRKSKESVFVIGEEHEPVAFGIGDGYVARALLQMDVREEQVYSKWLLFDGRIAEKVGYPEEKSPYIITEEDGKMSQAQGQFELLMADIEAEVAGAKGGWWITDNNTLCVHQRVSQDPSRRTNGGEYDYYKRYTSNGFGVQVVEDWSCEIAPRTQYGGEETYYDCIVSINGLHRMAQLAEVTTAAKAWLAKEPGCMSRLKAAIRALEA